MQKSNWLLIGVVTLVLAACGGKKAVTPSSSGSSVPGATTSSLDSPAAASVSGEGDGSGVARNINAPAERIIYFDFDSNEIKPEYNAVLKAHATELSRNASVRVRLEGHTDERGSREYNIGLAERRAQAVRRSLMLQGVAEGQLSTVSYGEEKPAQSGSTEAAWAKNRRVEIVYLN
jgi:peptidoglycan-associated lipoprotein